jgi:hypothetical protein
VDADAWCHVNGRRPNMLLADTDVVDLLGSHYLSTVREALSMVVRAKGAATTQILPAEVLIHVALVESPELLRLNAVSGPVAGLDLSSINELSHRTRAIRLDELDHKVLTRPCVALRLSLDGATPPEVSGCADVELGAAHAGEVHAIVSWFSARLERAGEYGEGGIAFSSRPGEGGKMRGHNWGQCCHYLPRVQAGRLSIDESETFMLRTRW